MPKVNAPTFLALLIAAKVSAVSPDWLIAISKLLLFIVFSLYLNSEAYSTLTGLFRISSII